MRAVQQITQLRYVEPVGLEVGHDRGLLGGEPLGGLQQPAAKPGRAGRDLDHQSHAGADSLGLRGTESLGGRRILGHQLQRQFGLMTVILASRANASRTKPGVMITPLTEPVTVTGRASSTRAGDQ